MTDQAHKGDVTTLVGTIKDGGVVVDVSSATLMQIKLESPTGVVATKTAVFDTDGTDGRIKYLTSISDLIEVGMYKFQGFVTITGFSGHSDIVNFDVLDNIE